jgi:hypothetical protein
LDNSGNHIGNEREEMNNAAFVAGIIFGAVIVVTFASKIKKARKEIKPSPKGVINRRPYCGIEYPSNVTECPIDKNQLVQK